MITAKINTENTLITDIADDTGKTLTICSSKVESDYLSPRQLVQSALAGCLSITIRRTLINNDVEFEDVFVKVNQVEREEGTTFIYDITIVSDEDIAVVNRLKEKAVDDCYIRGLLSAGIHIEEGKIHSGTENNIFDRCCD